MGWGLLGERGIEPIISPMYFGFRFVFSVCIRSESIFLQLFFMMLSVCFYIRYIPNLYCYHDQIGVSYDFVFAVQIFHLRSSPVPEFVLIFVAISPVIGLLWNFRGQLNDVYSEKLLKLLISDLLGYPHPARKNSNGPCDLDIWPIHTSSHASDHLVSNREIIHPEQYMM